MGKTTKNKPKNDLLSFLRSRVQRSSAHFTLGNHAGARVPPSGDGDRGGDTNLVAVSDLFFVLRPTLLLVQSLNSPFFPPPT